MDNVRQQLEVWNSKFHVVLLCFLFYKQIYFYFMFFYTVITAKSMVNNDIHYILS